MKEKNKEIGKNSKNKRKWSNK